MRFLMLFLTLLPVLLSAKNLRCDVCRKQIRGRYIVSGGNNFCSDLCFEKTLPNCAACGSKIKKGHYEYKGKKYCSTACMETVVPKCSVCGKPISGAYKIFETAEGKRGQTCMQCSKLPPCFACEMYAKTERLPDGRHICRACGDQRLTSEEEQALFREIKQKVEQILGKKIRCPMKLRIVDSRELKRLFPEKIVSPNEIKLGTCQVNMQVQKRNRKKRVIQYECTIYLLDNMPRGKFIDAASHELAHHWQYHQYPFLSRDPLKIPEGFAEYVSSLVNDAYGQPEYNRRKEKRRDSVYGAGYRMYRKIAGQQGLPAVFHYMKKKSSE